ncbi:MAG: hypothetical protein WAM55_11380 [Methylovirgula sp.]
MDPFVFHRLFRVMAGLDPAIHAARSQFFGNVAQQRIGVDGRHKAGHDD